MSDTRIYDASTGVNVNQICHTDDHWGGGLSEGGNIAAPFLAPAIATPFARALLTKAVTPSMSAAMASVLGRTQLLQGSNTGTAVLTVECDHA
jgi:hypothetical protein